MNKVGCPRLFATNAERHAHYRCKKRHAALSQIPQVHGGCYTLYHGDAQQILPALTGIDVILTDPPYSSTTPHGRFALQLFAAMAEYERALIHERVMAGLAAARARGRKGGRRPKLSPEQQQLAADMAKGRIPITTIAQTLQCSRHTVYVALRSVQSIAASV